MKRALLLVLICACRTTSEAESHMAASAANTLNTDQQTDTHIVDAPDRTTTTVEEFALPEAAPSVGPAPADHEDAGVALPADRSVRPPVLIKRTVIVTEHGAVTIDKHVDAKSQERADSTLSSESETKKTRDFLHSPFALLGGLVALAGVAFAAFKILKPRLLP